MEPRNPLRTAFLESESDAVEPRLSALAPSVELHPVSSLEAALEAARAGEIDVLLVASSLDPETFAHVESEVALVVLGSGPTTEDDVAVVLPASPLTPEILALALRAARDRWSAAARARRVFSSAELFESLPIGVAVADLDDRLVGVNPAAGALVGAAPAALEDHPSTALVPSSGTTIVQLLAKAANGEATPIVRKSKRLVRPDGTAARAHVAAALVHDAAGKPVACVRAIVDVTADREREERLLVDVAELRAAEQFLQAVVENMPAAVLVVDRADGAPLLSNGRFRDLVGDSVALGASELAQLVPFLTREGEPVPVERTPLVATLADGLAHGADDLWLEREGDRLAVSAQAAPLAWGDRAAAILVIQDLSDLRRQESLRSVAERRLARLFEQASDSILLATPDLARIVDANPAARALFGFEPDELARGGLLGLSAPTQTNGETAEAFFAGKLDLARRSGLARFTWLGRGAHGRTVELEAIAQLVADDAGGELLAVQARDVTAQRLLEEELRTSQKLEAIGLLAGGVAHDFNNLLTGVVGFQQLALEGLQHANEAGATRARVLIERGHRSALRAVELTSQLLAFSRKSRTPSLAPMDLRASVERAAALIRPLVGAKVVLDLELPAEEHTVRGNPAELEEALVRLAVNARDAMPDGGALSLSLRRGPGDKAVIEVADTGTGMTDEVKRRVFEPFFTTKARGRGTGMGLAVTHGIVRRHAGRIFVESSPGEGTRFTIEIPLCADERPAAVPPSGPLPIERGRGESVLVVDDDPLVREVTAAMLGSLGYRVDSAASGAEALAKEEASPHDLVVSDVVMPGMSGTELAHALAKRRPGVRILLITGYSGEAFAAGVDEGALARLPVLAKPLTLEALSRRVREVLGARAH